MADAREACRHEAEPRIVASGRWQQDEFGDISYIPDNVRPSTAERAEAFRFVTLAPASLSRWERGVFFRHPPASRVFAAQTGGPSGARERDPKGGA